MNKLISVLVELITGILTVNRQYQFWGVTPEQIGHFEFLRFKTLNAQYSVLPVSRGHFPQNTPLAHPSGGGGGGGGGGGYDCLPF